MTDVSASAALGAALAARRPRVTADGALRLFAGHAEGHPGLVVDWFARTAVVFDHAKEPRSDVDDVVATIVRELPDTRAVVWKRRHARETDARRGVVPFGDAKAVAKRVVEDGVSYALDVFGFRDGSFYVDTRALRAFVRERAPGRRVLNLFAHTGSLGVAAKAAGAAEVVHVDRDRDGLNLAKTSYAMNRQPVERRDFVQQDVFPFLAGARREGRLFDLVLLDPPFFSTTSKGRVDLEQGLGALADKVRPLVADGGHLVMVVNGLFVSGAEVEAELERITASGYATVAARLPIPDDVLGLSTASSSPWPTDPAPYVHPTKIAVLELRRKDKRT